MRIPTLQRDSTNEFYVYYGGPTATDQQNKTGVWDNNFKGVRHMSATSGPTTMLLDSTANSNTGTKYFADNPSTTSTGQIDGAQDFDGDGNHINVGNRAPLQLTGSGTWSAWVNARAHPADDGDIISKSALSEGADIGWQFKTTPDCGTRTFGMLVTPDKTLSNSAQRCSSATVSLDTGISSRAYTMRPRSPWICTSTVSLITERCKEPFLLLKAILE